MEQMNSFFSQPTVGKQAAWALVFSNNDPKGNPSGDPLTITADDYYAEIRAGLPGGLEGGSYTFVIEGLTDDHYKTIKGLNTVKLHLFWQEINPIETFLPAVSAVTSLFGGDSGPDDDSLVAVLAVTSVSRKVGARRYEATIEARERVYDRVEKVRLCRPDLLGQMAKSKLVSAADTLAREAGIRTHAKPFSGAAELAAGLELNRTLLASLRSLGGRIEQEPDGGRLGRGIFLIRDGELYIGDRDFPLGGEQEIQALSTASGLLETEAMPDLEKDPNFDYCKHNSAKEEKQNFRRQFRLTCRGRPDIKPGSVVSFQPPEIDDTNTGGLGLAVADLVQSVFSEGLLTGSGLLGSDAPTFYVASVEHRLGRASSFSTTLVVVEINPKDPWDKTTPAHVPPAGDTSKSSPPSPEGRAAQAVRRQVHQALETQRFAEVGEVREANTSGTEEPPGQTSTIWRGLEPGNGGPHGARRLDIQRPSPAPIQGVPYLTPFAWGKCGLVLPRYPGTRVLVEHRNGAREDPVDLGAMWESGKGPESQAGDWWLSLPAAVPENERATIDGDGAPDEYTDVVSQDLIDADGNRIIELGELTIRIGRDSLKKAGERPDRADEEDSITIEHVTGESSIVMKSDGTVVIKAKKIQFEATQGGIDLTASNGNINLTSKNVNVKVDGKMDIS